jgi:threonine/homoserine/homoserine lactone efflux protein
MTENLSALATGFVVGYAGVLMAPGPNLFAIGAIAAWRGLRAALPLCAGIAVGATMLAVGICTAVGLGNSPAIEKFGRLAAVALLLYVGARILMRQPPTSEPGKGAAPEPSTKDAIALFVAGVSTAATNPITAAFFASQFLGAVSEPAPRIVALALVPCQSLLFSLTLGLALSQPVARRMVTAWNRPIRFLAAAILAATATIAAVPLVRGAPEVVAASSAPAAQSIGRTL